MKSKFEIGDCIVVKSGVLEPDLKEFELGGWQGLITEIDTKSGGENILITIELDALTLKQMPIDFIAQSEIEGYDWQKMVLYDSNIEKTIVRTTKQNTKKVQEQLSKESEWFSLGSQGERILKILENIDPDNQMICYPKWIEHLEKELKFPIEAEVSDSESNRVIKIGDKVTIKELTSFDDMYGIIVEIKVNRKKFFTTLCDLEVIDRQSSNYQLIEDYKEWFSQR